MTARRGSLHYKIVRLARVPRAQAGSPKRWRFLRIAARIAGRCVMALAVVFVSGTIAVQIWHVGERNVQLHQQIGQMERGNANLQVTNDKLRTRVDRLHDPEYLVPLIHEQLGLTKPHEIFVEVTQATPEPASAQK
ncbi:MAG TPA: septum formation initiator family protein [Candidatus Eremiobacteraceae bacterium]|jgi:cell division protein FtsB|nr:septum formation initiator family protein [Candidatus Eremiobacteraceae bacterium]